MVGSYLPKSMVLKFKYIDGKDDEGNTDIGPDWTAFFGKVDPGVECVPHSILLALPCQPDQDDRDP